MSSGTIATTHDRYRDTDRMRRRGTGSVGLGIRRAGLPLVVLCVFAACSGGTASTQPSPSPLPSQNTAPAPTASTQPPTPSPPPPKQPRPISAVVAERRTGPDDRLAPAARTARARARGDVAGQQVAGFDRHTAGSWHLRVHGRGPLRIHALDVPIVDRLRGRGPRVGLRPGGQRHPDAPTTNRVGRGSSPHGRTWLAPIQTSETSSSTDAFRRPDQHLRELAVVPGEVADAADGWAADGGVVAVMVVAVEPAVKAAGSLAV